MFEAVELGRSVSKDDWNREVPLLRARLLKAQLDLRTSNVPVIVLISGADGAGKSETVNRLHEWLDPRGLESNVYAPPTDEERERPKAWRFWRQLPARGRIGMFFGSWYTEPIIDRTYGRTKNAELEEALERVTFFEELLARDGALIVKFWFHLGKKAQKRRLEKLSASKETRWRVNKIDWKHYRMYDKFVEVSERALRATDTALAPWILVDAEDDRYRELFVGRTLVDALERRLADGTASAAIPVAAPSPPKAKSANVSVLDRVDLGAKWTEKNYEKELTKWQGRLARATRKAYETGVSTVVVFEGWDAAGKGGTIRRLTSAMDARLYRVIPIAAPTDEERAHHYLWRFWRNIPRAGRVTIFDRSWYGRVLVERVEGFAKPEEWRRSFHEINAFEQQLAESGIAVLKLWLHISPAEQLRRFRDRQATAYKRHKITAEDWRNRKRRKAYEGAIEEMVARTSTEHAPWKLISAEDKRNARLVALREVTEHLERAL